VGCKKQDSASTSYGYVYGTLGDVQIRIPKDEVFIFDYVDTDDGASKLQRSCASQIASATLFLRWPGMDPKNAKNESDFKATRWKSIGDTQWMDVGFLSSALRKDYKQEDDEYLGRLKRFYLNKSEYGMANNDLEVKYDDKNLVLGLNSALVIGPPSTPVTATKATPEEYRLYWRSHDDQDKSPATLIKCATGERYDPPRWTPLCNMKFHIKEMNMDVRVGYTANLLPEWLAIENAVRSHLSSYKASCPQ